MSALKTLRNLLTATTLAISAASGTAFAEPVTVAWDPNPVAEAVTGYFLYYGETSVGDAAFRSYDVELDVGNVTEYTVDLPDVGTTYYLAVVAYNAANLRSDYSDEVARNVVMQTTYTVTASSGVGGAVSPSGSVIVTEGDDLTVTLASDSGYAVADVLVDGSSVGAVDSYTFSNIHADHTVSATFQILDTVDNDNDQLPDAWELLYFSGTAAAEAVPDADPDHDGLTNLQEYLAGTDPTVADLDPALTPSVASPISGATVASREVELAVDNPVNETGTSLTYEFQVALQQDMTDQVATASGLVEGTSGVTTWPLPLSLDDQTRYYWRARAVAGDAASEWTPVNTFYLDTAAAPTTTELVTAEYVPAATDVSVDILDPTSTVAGLGVDIPAATLPYDFILTVSTVDNPPEPLRAARLAGTTMEFGPHGRPFSDQVTILLPYDAETLADAGVNSGADLDVLTYNTESLRWEVVPNTVNDPMGNRVIAQVDHFSMYSLGVASADTPVVVPSSSGGGGGGCFIGSLW